MDYFTGSIFLLWKKKLRLFETFKLLVISMVSVTDWVLQKMMVNRPLKVFVGWLPLWCWFYIFFCKW